MKRLIPTFAVIFFLLPAISHAGNLTAFWVSGGGDKIPRQEFYPHGFSTMTITSNWDGHTAKAQAFRNETISLVPYMRAGASDATNCNVIVSSLTGPNGSGVASVVVSSMNVFDWNNRPIEVFYVRYLQIKGLSKLGADPSEYEARHQSVPFRRPCTINGNDQCIPNGGTGWVDRPYHNMFIPDITVPYEAIAASSFTVAASSSQAIWIDYYFGKTLSTGTYTGTITIREGVDVSTIIPVSIQLRNGILPDVHTMKSIGVVSRGDIAFRHHGERFPSSYQVEPYYTTTKRYYQMLHRHGISPVGDDNTASDTLYPTDLARLKGTLYSSATGYANASGQDTGDKVMSFGTYGSWQGGWSGATTNSSILCTHIGNLQDVMVTNSLTDVIGVFYTTDETLAGGDVEKWAGWTSTVTACQNASYKIRSWITYDWVDVYTDAPHIEIPATAGYMGASSTTWETRANYYLITGGSRLGFNYNGTSPWTASVFNHEGEGWEPREIAWGNFKHGASRLGVAFPHFLWMTNYYYDSNDSHAENNLWVDAVTFGYRDGGYDSVFGQTGYQWNNGDGVFMYPGHDLSYPANDYGLDGPFASWRMKMYRRAIQDADIMAQAYAISASSTMAIVNAVVPKVLWEYYCFQPADCTYGYGERGFLATADAYESAKEALTDIIDENGGTPSEYCGDSICNNGETCSSCPGDCGACPDNSMSSIQFLGPVQLQMNGRLTR